MDFSDAACFLVGGTGHCERLDVVTKTSLVHGRTPFVQSFSYAWWGAWKDWDGTALPRQRVKQQIFHFTKACAALSGNSLEANMSAEFVSYGVFTTHFYLIHFFNKRNGELVAQRTKQFHWMGWMNVNPYWFVVIHYSTWVTIYPNLI